ncbi:MAG: transposase [Anaerolineae bacterium]
MSDDWCYHMLRRYRWPQGVTCVRCGSRRVTVHTRSGRTPRLRYLCLQCRRTFTDLTGTIFARSNLPLSTWFMGFSLFPQGLSTAEYARALSVKWDTARRMSRCLLVSASRPGLVRDLEGVLIGGQRKKAR